MHTCCHDPIHCILPPHIVDQMSRSSDAKIRKLAMDAMEATAAMRAQRVMFATLPMMSAIPSPAGKKHRLIYDAKHGSMWTLPGVLARSEGGKKG